MAGVKTVEEYRQSMTPAQLAIVDRLRILVMESDSRLVERIKWNAPSFARENVDRITMGQDRHGNIRVILHRGVKPKPMNGFVFAAPTDLVKWAAPDRGVLTFMSLSALESRAAEIADIFRRWMETE